MENSPKNDFVEIEEDSIKNDSNNIEMFQNKINNKIMIASSPKVS